MYFSFCTGKRRGKDRLEAKATSRSPISWTPSPHGQVESSRLIAGDSSAAPDLTKLIDRAGATSARLPYLNSNGAVATSNLLVGHTEDGVSRLAKEQAHAERRSRAARPWTFGSLFFSNASLIGVDFQEGILGLYGQRSRQSVQIDETPTATTCRGHWEWKLVYCDFEGCSVYHRPSEHPPTHPPAPEKVESLPEKTANVPLPKSQRASITPSLEEQLTAQESDEESVDFPFKSHLWGEDVDEQSVCEVTAVATRPGTPQLVTLSRKHEAGSVETMSAVPKLKAEEAADEQRWSTQAQNGCSKAAAEAPKTKRPQSFRRLAGPPSGPPSVPLPPNPPRLVSSSPMRFSE
ncbi:hypothetical protein KVR01_004880 [Diaporthe batatas]|uniref:uncharacterized protein n=1 Tax=Diaporthe batatas TaxID=748121 RepID=UPI001D048798|nr:uncharacterized protein KVR01_004880 [Diaporthe batatas]KAG8164605.1 hypothetical protein KVR01_004880 [Diaporthe batatas]